MYNKLDTPRASRGEGARRTAVLVVALFASLLGAAAAHTTGVRAQLAYTIVTTTAVAPGGTLTIAPTAQGVSIMGTSGTADCSADVPAAVVTFTCTPTGIGMPAGTKISQTLSVPFGPISELLTYNANGPSAAFPRVDKATTDTGACTTPTGAPSGHSTCTVQTSVTTVPLGVLRLVVGLPGGQTVDPSSTPDRAGTCTLAAKAGFVTTTLGVSVTNFPYDCAGGQSISAGTSLKVTVYTGGATQPPGVVAEANFNAPLAAFPAIPAPTGQAITVGGPIATLASLNPSSGPAGTVVTLTGTNLGGETGVSFDMTAATNVLCNSAGTSCAATAPSLSAGTAANVTVTTSGASSNALTFTFVPATTAAAAPNTANTATTPASTSAAPSSVAAVSAVPVTSTNAVAPAASAGISISYAAGWNIAAGPTASVITGTDGPLYAYPAGSSDYQVVASGAPLQAGQGYWAFFDSAATVTIPVAGPQSINVVLPAGQWVLVGNPGNTAAGVSGADVVYVYSTATGYQTTPTLGPGQGAWVFSSAGDTVTISNR